jgi:ubiquinone/menaquinone biosynthesis C-methylase UbiE
VTEDYEYRGLVAQAWDLLRGDYSTWPDRLFFREVIERQGGAALDVGCGTGRLILDYLATGLDVDGVDNSPEMLALCSAKAVGLGLQVDGRLFQQEMDQLALARKYATIFVPSLSIQLLTDPAAATAAMTRFRDHLADQGILALSFKSQLWPGRRTPPQMEWSAWYKLAEQPREDGATIRRFVRAKYDHGQQLEHEENRYEVWRDGELMEAEFHSRSPAVRWYSQSQALALFEQAGFIDLSLTSESTFDPATPDDISFKIRGTRP